MKPKHALIIAAGAADQPLEELDGRTPFEAAVTPALDEIVRIGRQGTVQTIPRGFAPSRDVATLSLLGYDVRRNYTGFAGIEAAARRLRLAPEAVAFRCNFVTVEDGVLVDHTAGHIPTADARRLVDALNAALGSHGVRLYAGLSYRALMVTSHPWAAGVSCTPAHDGLGERVDRHWPGGRGAGELRDIIRHAADVLATHDVNQARRELGENPANAVWPWGQGVFPRLRRFRQRFGLHVACIGAVDLIRGAAVLLGASLPEVAGMTGDPSTDYAAKGRAALAALDAADLVIVHVEAPDEASHAGELPAKIKAIEQIDALIVRPLLEHLRRLPRWSLLFAPDLAAHVQTRMHGGEPVPFCLAGSAPFGGIEQSQFGEGPARRSDLHVACAWDLMEYFLRS